MEWHNKPELPLIIAGFQKGREAKGSFTMGWPKGFHRQQEFKELSTSSELSENNQQKTIWDLRDNVIEPSYLSFGSYSLFPTIVRIDQWGNIGDASGNNDPDPIPDEDVCPTVTGATVLSVTSEAALLIRDSNVEQPDEQGFISVTGASVLSASSMETLIIRDSNQEQPDEQGFISVTGATVLSVTSNQV